MSTPRRSRTLPVLLVAVAAGAALTGCAAPVAPIEGLSIVASTDVYGDIAAAIAGDLATVTSIIDSAAQDPHSYEASALDQLAIAGADLVIENGGGYDSFIDVLIDGSATDAVIVTAVVASGLVEADHAAEGAVEDDHAADDADDHGHLEGTNEHVWYDVHAMGSVASAIASALVALDQPNAAVYEQNLAALASELDALEGEIEALADELGGGTVVSTEPVPAYLLAELGLEDVTPTEFLQAVEEGADVPPLALQQTLDLLASGEVRLLAYNEQTASPETERVRDAAEAAGIPVVSFAETLPDAQDYVSWMRANLEAIAGALTPA